LRAESIEGKSEMSLAFHRLFSEDFDALGNNCAGYYKLF
jgi:hypothetical protein